MEPRIRIFCDLAAPIYQQMAERHDYRHFVYYSKEMPERWTDALNQAAVEFPVLRPTLVDSDRINTIGHIESILAERRSSKESLVFLFRVDDDDILALDFLDQVSEYMHELHRGYAVSLADGFAGLYEDGEYREFRRHTHVLSSMGQGTIGAWAPADGKLRIPQIVNHGKTHFRRSVLVNAQRPTFLQTRHVGQDTASQGGAVESLEMARADLLTRFSRLKAIDDVSELKSQFPTVSVGGV